jgi:hypothetical protein
MWWHTRRNQISVFRRNGQVHLNRQGRQFNRQLTAEVCASAVVMLDTPSSELVWRVLATHSIRQFPLQFPSRVPSRFNCNLPPWQLPGRPEENKNKLWTVSTWEEKLNRFLTRPQCGVVNPHPPALIFYNISRSSLRISIPVTEYCVPSSTHHTVTTLDVQDKFTRYHTIYIYVSKVAFY